MIYPVDSVIHLLKNPGLEYSSYGVFFHVKVVQKISVFVTDVSTTEAEVIFRVGEKCLSVRSVENDWLVKA